MNNFRFLGVCAPFQQPLCMNILSLPCVCTGGHKHRQPWTHGMHTSSDTTASGEACSTVAIELQGVWMNNLSFCPVCADGHRHRQRWTHGMRATGWWAQGSRQHCTSQAPAGRTMRMRARTSGCGSDLSVLSASSASLWPRPSSLPSSAPAVPPSRAG